MSKANNYANGIPVSVSLVDALDEENLLRPSADKTRIIRISMYAILIAAAVSVIAKFLVYLIHIVTNLSFFGQFSLANNSPANHTLGWIVIFVPVLGGLLVGLMAMYGSKAIRGHGIPEAMEQILTNKSRIKPSITYLKPLSSALAIGTGGPFGAEGPIIATGGALGSTMGQVLRITHSERKVLLVAGATAGMSAIFGSPIAAVFLAIELLLFEFSPRSIIPVALACITGAAGHHFLFESGPVFQMPIIPEIPGNYALLGYSAIGLAVGILSILTTKCVYWIEDLFEHLPIHWMWWPALGGLFVGIIGFFSPQTLGVGYNNITDLLSGSTTIQLVVSLCVLKFLSWAIALGSGTSGGTLAPLLTIGAACGVLLATVIQYWFPGLDISIPLAALIGMSSMFAGASRALLTSIVFALETTGQANALVPLLAACTGSYIISFLFMENTIMTEKIVRRGVKTPHSFEPDMMKKIFVKALIPNDKVLITENVTISELKDLLNEQPEPIDHHIVVVDQEQHYLGMINVLDVIRENMPDNLSVGDLVFNSGGFLEPENTLSEAISLLMHHHTDVLPVIADKDKTVIGVISYKDLLKMYSGNSEGQEQKRAHISLRRKSLKIVVIGRNLIKMREGKNK